MPPVTAAALLSGVVDYAGLFPPAGLDMPAAVAEYARGRAGADAWMLGRFVAPASRLVELAEALAIAPVAGSEWRVSAIVRDESDADVAAIEAFNNTVARHHARVDTVESKPASLAGIDWLASQFGAGVEVYVEITPGDDADRWLQQVKARGLRAKVRTGGLTAEAFPAPDVLAAFLAAAVRRQVPFKATAGLHHAVRGAYRLTYEPQAAQAPMYGYLNILLATAALHAGEPPAAAAAILQQSDTSSLAFTDGAARWGVRTFSPAVLRDTRARHLVSFGSCSFTEPVEEFDALVSR